MVAKIVRKVDQLDITQDGGRYFVFNGLEQLNSFNTLEDAVRFSIDESKRVPGRVG